MNQGSNNNPSPPIKILDPLILFIFALVLRLLFLPYGLNLPLGGDEKAYWLRAICVASGKLVKNFGHPPLWGYVLSIAASISKSPPYGRLFTTLISSLAVPLVYFIGTRSFSRKVGIIAGVIYLVDPNNIGFSHYLWSEPLFALLVLVSTYFFFKAIYEKVKSGRIYLSMLVAGLGLLANGFAVILFAAFITILSTLDINKKKRVLILATIIFLAPAALYSMWASISARRVVILTDSPIYNANERMGFFSQSREEGIRILLSEPEKRFYQIPTTFTQQFYNLWQPNSFPVFRLLRADDKFGNYHTPYARMIAYIIVGFYVFLVLTGLTGICFGDNTPFRMFAICNVAYISLLSAMFLLCSRFRLPFMFIFTLYSSAVISDPKTILTRLTCWHRALVWVVLILLFIHIVVTKRPNVGYWG